MNRLRHEISPYLLQHAHNPVDWYPWGEEAFETARRLDRPVLVSIGYSTCHWCHVMERESFEDEEVAEFMNTHFVNVKVDREERPDVDDLYMEACQILTGSGGWPLNVFLTPDGKPFYAGTYYPPIPAHGRPSWLQVLMSISHAWQHKREEVERQAENLMEMLRNADSRFYASRLKVESGECPFSEEHLRKVIEKLLDQADGVYGGFGGAPKFPSSMALEYLLAWHHYTGERRALDHVALSLDKMAAGGLYDHLGGGFARYSTDARWLVPHFEKMLYDNALLVSLYSHAWQVLGKPRYREVVEETLEWVQREMSHPEGGFYSAIDADSEGEEGKFYVWTVQEIREVLGAEADIFCKYHGVSEKGNWEGKNILHVTEDEEQFASAHGMDVSTLKQLLQQAKRKLLEARQRRVRPGLDDKVLLDWNSLMVKAHLDAFHATGNEQYRDRALQALDFLLENFSLDDSRALCHSWKDGSRGAAAFLDDYAFLIEALLAAYQATFEERWLLTAMRYCDYVLEQFLDPSDKMFYFSTAESSRLPVRKKTFYDTATPSGNASMVRNLQRLGILLDRESWRRLAVDMLFAMRESIVRFPSVFSWWAWAMLGEKKGYLEVAVVGPEYEAMAEKILERYLPHLVIMGAFTETEAYPLLENRNPQNNDTLIYVCRNYTCQQPVSTIEAFDELVGSGSKRPSTS